MCIQVLSSMLKDYAITVCSFDLTGKWEKSDPETCITPPENPHELQSHKLSQVSMLEVSMLENIHKLKPST